jgi:hypothetical protein
MPLHQVRAARKFDGAPVFLDQREAATLLRLSVRTLERRRIDGSGPPFRAFGRRRVYALEDLVEWADAQRRTSTSNTVSLEASASAQWSKQAGGVSVKHAAARRVKPKPVNIT